MREFWSKHEWPPGERRLHWLVVFDDAPEVARCHAAHEPVLAGYRRLIDPVPTEWLHLTLQSLCPSTAVSDAEQDQLRAAVRDSLTGVPPARVQLGPARIDGAAVTWAVYPEEGLVEIQSRVRAASLDVLGSDRIAPQRSRWWPHVTLGYGATEEPADEELAATLAKAGLPRVEVTIDAVTLVDEEQDLQRREYRWHPLGSVPVGGPTAR